MTHRFGTDNDATPRVWYSLVSPSEEGIAFDCRPLDYDHARAAAKMRSAGLPQGYAEGLETGLWPNTDILPAVETAATGTTLDPATAHWKRFSAAAE